MQGYIFDIYPDYEKDCIAIWLNSEGKTFKLEDENFHPYFYVAADDKKAFLGSLKKEVESGIINISPEDSDLFYLDGRICPGLLRIEVARYSSLTALADKINRSGGFKHHRLFNVDIGIARQYLIEKQIFPAGAVEVNGEDGFEFFLRDSLSELDYIPPELSEVFIEVEVKKQSRFPAMSDALCRVKITSTHGKIILAEKCESELLLELQGALRLLDPDIIYTRGGDSFVFPFLIHRAQHNELKDFSLGREPNVYGKGREKSYFSYGRVLYRPAFYMLRGRIHIDIGNSFFYSESKLQGLIELSRLSSIPLQHLSRVSPGNAITAMQLRYAVENSILVPWKRQNPEYFKSAGKLLLADRGGFIYEPEVGLHGNAAELDFASLFPNIMRKYNISPETVLCRCCHDSGKRVPVLDYHICEHKTGLVPMVIAPLIERRANYKKMMKGEKAEIYRQRQLALKWVLVTSFGYMGYRNARFGRIECHEAITAYAREVLLEASKIAEQHGFRILHGIVDSLWVEKTATAQAELQDLAEEISKAAGIPLNVEGKYKWIVFLPCRLHRGGALNRYYGLFENGELKIRGIEARRRDTPLLIKKLQMEMLARFAEASNPEEFKGKMGEAIDVLRAYTRRLLNREVEAEDLVFTITISKDLRDYKQNSLLVSALKQYRRDGCRLLPGQVARYVIASQSRKRVKIAEDLEAAEYDCHAYLDHLIRAAESMLIPFGFTGERLRKMVSQKHEVNLKYTQTYI